MPTNLDDGDDAYTKNADNYKFVWKKLPPISV
jgi:hypothetical protein